MEQMSFDKPQDSLIFSFSPFQFKRRLCIRRMSVRYEEGERLIISNLCGLVSAYIRFFVLLFYFVLESKLEKNFRIRLAQVRMKYAIRENTAENYFHDFARIFLNS